MSDGGWIKIHRSLLKHHILKDPVLLAFWMHLLLRANHEDVKVKRGKGVEVIHRGELILSTRGFCDKYGITTKQVRRCLDFLKKDTMIDTRTDTLGTIVTILNYNKYQSTNKDSGTPKGTPKGTRGAHEGHTRGTRGAHDLDPDTSQTLEPQGIDSIISIQSQEPKSPRAQEPPPPQRENSLQVVGGGGAWNNDELKEGIEWLREQTGASLDVGILKTALSGIKTPEDVLNAIPLFYEEMCNPRHRSSVKVNAAGFFVSRLKSGHYDRGI